MNLRWFLSGTVRQANDMCKHVEKLLNAQRDILPNSALVAVTPVVQDTRESIRLGADDATLRQKMEELEGVVAKWIKPYPNAEWRENIEVFLVAIVVAMAIRTFFLQPFKIPTGSMQPTLYGVTEKDLRGDRDFKMPNMLQRIYEAAVHGVIYHQIIAPDDGQVDLFKIGPVQHVFLINKQTFWVKYEHQAEEVPITLWFGPDDHFEYYAGLDKRSVFNKGEPIVCFQEKTGDHLFVDRFTFNFRPPKRGDIVVFKTKGIDGIAQDQFYIKRLVGLPGETVSIGDDRHARINGVRLDSSTPHFENVYGFDPEKDPPRESHYSGHILESRSILATPDDSLKIPERSYVVFGDNTMNSLDSRYWRYVPQDNVIGKSFFIYWPISDRFGWGQR